MPRRASNDQAGIGKKRVQKACKRCRDLKIRCTGTQPCSACEKKNHTCSFADQSEKILVTRRYISDLQQRLAVLENKLSQSARSTLEQVIDPSSDPRSELEADDPATTQARSESTQRDAAGTTADVPVLLTNPLAFHSYNWVPQPKGRPMFMGTSSNWAFGRRVLNMTSVRLLGHPLPPDKLLFDSTVYDLQWDGNKLGTENNGFDTSVLPTKDYAIYLVNAVNYNCCRVFYLFEEEDFMRQLNLFHIDPVSYARNSPLWYAHYLLILAFGKAFVVRSVKSGQPPGLDLFVQAMKCMPDFTFLKADPVQRIQVLCCVALYLQCLSCRTAAYRAITQAVSLAIPNGMHTDMNDPYLESGYVQRCRAVWWTVYTLDRLMSSFMGVPGGTMEETINTPLPTYTGEPQKRLALEIRVKLCQVLAKIDRTVYGTEGKIGSTYLSTTQSVLRSIADVTEQLKSSCSLHVNEGVDGICRISASLHLLQHQCIITTTRPLLYIFLQSRLGVSDSTLMHLLGSQSVKRLLQICVESAQQSLRILSLLLDQGLLETFLPFDLETTFTSTTPLLMAAAIDSSLLSDKTTWSQRAYRILNEMAYRENAVAKMYHFELEQLESQLDQLINDNGRSNHQASDRSSEAIVNNADNNVSAPSTLYMQPWATDPSNESEFNYELSAEQLIDIADVLEIENLAWPLLDLAN